MNPSNAILLTIDVEDWFQVENFKQYIPFSSWPSCELRVEKNTHRILDLLDLFSGQQSAVSNQPQALSQEYEGNSTVAGSIQKSASNEQGLSTDLHNASETDEAVSGRRRVEVSQFHQETEKEKISGKSGKSCLTTPKATFFALGWIAERLPHLIRDIHARGHEVACHGYCHNLCIDYSPKDLRTDLINSKNLLEDIIGDQVYGYRAPSFSISDDILKIIEDCGYLYDSSFNSFGMHGRYGHLDLSQNGTRGIALQISKTNHQSSIVNRQSSIFFELPISNIKLGNRILPWGGGAYFRLIPFPIFRLGVQSILKKEKSYLFYIHPWEIDPEQPKVNGASMFYKLRHYVNMSNTYSKLAKLLEAFTHCRFITCRQYLEEIGEKTIVMST